MRCGDSLYMAKTVLLVHNLCKKQQNRTVCSVLIGASIKNSVNDTVAHPDLFLSSDHRNQSELKYVEN